ncbi:membrane protein insertase YidC [Asticcacaulis solisilvae]|uniref:membrane protein insertase YidC n=1 Tax=Asticcacaulis solisilvae TaxID=1217274 RepID=UPI003FD78512
MNDTANNKNMIFFLISCMVLLFGYQFFIVKPQQEKAQKAQAAAASASSSSQAAGLLPSAVHLTRDQALAQSPRVTIDTPSVKGSIALKGAVIDDLYLVKYKQTTEKGSPNVELLSPAGTETAFYVDSGFSAQNLPNAPTVNTVWTAAPGSVLSVGHPVVLTYDNGAGLKFTRTLSIDDNYMITEADQVTNATAQAVALAPYAQVVRYGIPSYANHDAYVHEGAIATYSLKPGQYITKQSRYRDLADGKKTLSDSSTGGWFGITDKYWMTAVIPDQTLNAKFTVQNRGDKQKPIFATGYMAAAPVTIAPGQTWSTQSHIFAGAKQDDMLAAYAKSLNLPLFNKALDWGSLEFITHPFFLLLTWLYSMVHNYGLAILCLTVIVKLAFYPLAHRSYEQMTKMKHVQQRLQPKLDAIKKRFPDDMQKQQEATMQLYQEEKVNPMAGLGGCLPMLLQLPVFICLVKVLQMDIGLRQAPFFGWIHDLSAPDPKTIMNLFGLIPYTPATVPFIGGFLDGPLHVGPVAILYGLSMWASQNFTPMSGIDPMQKRMMAFMPLIMVFFFSQLAIGLMIYYFWSNLLTILQQYTIMRRMKVDNPIDDLIAKITGKTEKKVA